MGNSVMPPRAEGRSVCECDCSGREREIVLKELSLTTYVL